MRIHSFQDDLEAEVIRQEKLRTWKRNKSVASLKRRVSRTEESKKHQELMKQVAAL